jgi:hypothetical protein
MHALELFGLGLLPVISSREVFQVATVAYLLMVYYCMRYPSVVVMVFVSPLLEDPRLLMLLTMMLLASEYFNFQLLTGDWMGYEA